MVTGLADVVHGRTVVASVSGGKDSAAMSLWLTEEGIEHRRVFADTGWEHPETYRYLWDVLVPRLGPIDVVRGPLLMQDLVRKKGMFPSRVRRFCTQQLKVFPLRDYIRALDDDVVNALGIRAGESQARAQMPEWEWNADFDCATWRPLIAWSEADVIAMHRRHGLPPNPLYLLGAERVGCWPCIFARKSEIRMVADLDDIRIGEIRELERTIQTAGATFFHTHGRTSAPVRIDEAVDWSRTSRGGKQRELFAMPGEAGCVRWGLCDTDKE